MARATTSALFTGRAKLRQHGQTARGDVLRRRVEQRAMVREWNVVQIVVAVVSVESAPGAVAALQAVDPLPPAADCVFEFLLTARACRPIHRHNHDGRIVEIGIVRIGILKGPAARTHIWTLLDPIAFYVEDLQWQKPIETLIGFLDRAFVANFEQGMGGKSGVPHRRQAGLAIGFVLLDHQELFDRGARNRRVRMILRISKHVVHHDAVGHGRENRAQSILAVQPLGHELDRLVDGLAPQALGKQRLGCPQHRVDAAEEEKPRPLLMRSLGGRSDVLRRTNEKLVDCDCRGRCAPSASSVCSTSNGTITVRAQ